MDVLTHETVALLLEIQEVEIVLQESRIVHRQQSPTTMPGLQEKVADLRKRVPESILRRYDTLRRTGLGVTREMDGVCGGCRLNVPVGDLNRMRNSKIPSVCPNCGRFLLLMSRAPRDDA